MIDWNENLPDLKPKYLAIIQMIRYLIKDEQLLPNEKLPSERKLAENLNVDRSTVSRALAELTSAGLLIKKIGSGTFVSGLPQMQLLQKRVNWNIYLDNQETPIANNYKREIFQARFSNPKILDGANNELPIDLIPDLGDLQMNWQNFLMAQNNEEDIGYLPLISAIESIHRQKNQFNLKNQMLMITGGAQQSLLLILRALLQNGDAIAFASPSYFYSSPIFETLGVRTFDVPMKDGGIDVDVLEDVILKHRIKLLILNPTFQNPTGEIMSLSQRKKILEICQNYQIAIVEDDVFGWLINDDFKVPTFKSLAPENVIYISSLSKILGSNTRIGWIVVPKAIGQRLLQIQKRLDMVPSMLAQVMAYLALTSDDFDKEIANLQHKLTRRGLKIKKILNDTHPEWDFSIPHGGFYLWIKQDDPDIFQKLLSLNILVKPGPIYGASKKSFRFNFAYFNTQERIKLINALMKLN